MKDYNLLICDDDVDILNALEIYLMQDKYTIMKATNGYEALEIIENNEIHLVILDVMMPKMDGIVTSTKIREKGLNMPILFLSAKGEDTDRIIGLNMGGDDYITKPFNPVELLARVKAHLRRYERMGGVNKIEPLASEIFTTGGLVLNNETKQVTIDDEPVQLTAKEYNILKLLISKPNQVFSANQIYEYVWHEPAIDAGKLVSVHIRHLREKIEINPKEPQYIKIVYGLGYKVVNVI